MLETDVFHLKDIQDAIDEVKIIVGDRPADEFLKDRGGYYGTLYLLAVIGEASGKLSEEFKTEYPDVPWDQVKGMRNVLIHEYAEVSFAVVWKTLSESLPKLERVVKGALEKSGKG